MSRKMNYDVKTLLPHATTVWSGCGKQGPCMPCGRVHNFAYLAYGGAVDRFRCWHNQEQGCPQPHPAPKHNWKSGRCSVCGTRAMWVCPNGDKWRTVALALRYGWKRNQLQREDEIDVMFAKAKAVAQPILERERAAEEWPEDIVLDAARKIGEEPASLMDEALRLEAMARPVKIGEEQATLQHTGKHCGHKSGYGPCYQEDGDMCLDDDDGVCVGCGRRPGSKVWEEPRP